VFSRAGRRENDAGRDSTRCKSNGGVERWSVAAMERWRGMEGDGGGIRQLLGHYN
jgi:hypothetical protein